MLEVLQTASTAVLASSLIFFISGLAYFFFLFSISLNSINPINSVSLIHQPYHFNFN